MANATIAVRTGPDIARHSHVMGFPVMGLTVGDRANALNLVIMLLRATYFVDGLNENPTLALLLSPHLNQKYRNKIARRELYPPLTL
jgi:hypothetical protein